MIDREPNEPHISIRRLAANRRNAKLSTGPRTQFGKGRVRWNALGHGLTAKRLVLAGYESRWTYLDLVQKLVHELRPDGLLDQMKIEQLAVARTQWLRYLRVARNETLSATRRQEHDLREDDLDDEHEIGDQSKRRRSDDCVRFPHLEDLALL